MTMRLLLTTLTLSLLFSTPALGQTVEDAWDHYVSKIENIDELEVLKCYSKDLRAQFDDRTATGRAHLNSHRSLMYSFLSRDFGHAVVDKKENGDRCTITFVFRSRKGDEEYQQPVEFVREDGEWLIDKPPTGPSVFGLGGGLKMFGGGALALIVGFFVVRKLLG